MSEVYCYRCFMALRQEASVRLTPPPFRRIFPFDFGDLRMPTFSSYDIIYITNILLIPHLLDLCTRRMFPPEDLQLYLNITTTTISNPAEFLLRWYLADSRGNMPWTTETQRRVWSACLLLTTLLCSSLMNASSGAFIVPICMLCMYICTQNKLVE